MTKWWNWYLSLTTEVETEKQLLNEIKNGERGAQRRLYERFAGYLMAVCLRYLADREAAEDVLQDCFVKILTSVDHFEYRGEGSLKAWVTRLAVNESINCLRRNERLLFTDQIPDEAEEEAPDVGKVPLELLQRLIEELPVGYRAVFNLYVFEQMSHKEIANELGIKENSSASQYLRAKKLLARRIREYIKQDIK